VSFTSAIAVALAYAWQVLQPVLPPQPNPPAKITVPRYEIPKHEIPKDIDRRPRAN
jgi:hypothetical protein